MRNRIRSSRERLVGALAITLLVGVMLTVTGCKSINEPITEKSDAPVAAEAVQATMSVEPTAPSAPSTSTNDGRTAVVWPAKVGTFAANFKGGAWYPTDVPKAMKIDSLDVVEMEGKSGLVCDIVYYDGKTPIMFTQGSPTGRTYDIVSIGKTAWGSEQADIVAEDPNDPESPQMIVYSEGKTLAELSGTDIATLKAVAASMVPVK